MRIVLGIETSCDETAVSLVREDHTILSNFLYSQVEGHLEYGGVVPELAARAHLEKLAPLVEIAFEEANIQPQDISAVAATSGPGLIGGVIVGAMFGKGLAAAAKKPFIAVNHLEAHALTVRLTHKISFPYLLLLVSGGHCQFIEVKALGQYHVLGQTIDDAVGEAFDKVARMLDLPYPGGPKIEALAKLGSVDAYHFPRPLLKRPGCDFSFSGLKTAVRHKIQGYEGNVSDIAPHIAASFQQAIIDCLADRTQNAIKMLTSPISTLVVAGGVAANQAIHKALRNVSAEHSMDFCAPPIPFCTDNAAMIAWVGMERLQRGLIDGLDFEPRPRWPLSELVYF